MKILLDTDVNLDFILDRQPFFNDAKEIFIQIAQSNVEAYITSITPINIFYIGRKEIGRKLVLQEINKLLQIVKICQTDLQILQSALTSPITDFEDAVQHECAVAENLDAIVTRNLKDYKNSSIKVYSPSEFLQVLQTI